MLNTEDNRSILDVYMSEIARKPLLTRTEEYDIAVNVTEWNKKVKKLEKVKPRTKERQKMHGRELKAARKQLNYHIGQMIEGNYRLVINVAKKYTNNFLQLNDLIEEGNLGLLKAVIRFDPYRGYRFSTFAIQWIKQNITKAIRDKSRFIRVPVHIDRTLSKYRKFKNAYQQETGSEPDQEKMSSYMELPASKMNYLLNVSDQVVSLNIKTNDNEDEIGDVVVDSKATDDPQKRMIENSLRENIDSMLYQLKDTEKQIIIMRYGLNDYEPMTLDNIGNILNITRERVRQIQSSALKKMRNFRISNELKCYLN